MFADLLIDNCKVQRFVLGAADTYGVQSKNYYDHIYCEPCRLYPISNTEVVIDAEVVIANYSMFIGDVDVTEQDRIVIEDITYEILSVMLRRSMDSHHREILLRRVR